MYLILYNGRLSLLGPLFESLADVAEGLSWALDVAAGWLSALAVGAWLLADPALYRLGGTLLKFLEAGFILPFFFGIGPFCSILA